MMNIPRCQFAFVVAACLLLLIGVNGNALENVDETNLASAFAPQIFSALMHDSLLPVSHRQRRGIFFIASGSHKVGSCSARQFLYNSAICSRLLFTPYRNISGTGGRTCRSQIPELLECQKAVCRRCVSDPDQVALFMKKMDAAINTVDFSTTACDFGGYAKLSGSGMGDLCDKAFNVKHEQCTKEFSSLYLANRGDPKLCPVQTKTTSCLIDAMSSHCHGDGLKASLELSRDFNTKEINPFCSVSQGGTDEKAVMAGRLLNPPTSGASLPTISTMAISLFVLASAYLF